MMLKYISSDDAPENDNTRHIIFFTQSPHKLILQANFTSSSHELILKKRQYSKIVMNVKNKNANL